MAEAEEPLDLPPPVHPVPSMQGAFEESIIESTQVNEDSSPIFEKNAEKRRRRLLEATDYDASWQGRWQQSRDATYHPLWKLIAQIIFGMHLLQQDQAKSDEEVIRILQAHVNEVDGFLERTADDFGAATMDVEERIRYLKLPMQHIDVFQTMLNNHKFRNELLAGNEKIKRIISRTFEATNAAVYDIEKGIDATKELGSFLSSIREIHANGQSEVADIFAAMQANEQGWLYNFEELERKAQTLDRDLDILNNVVSDISRLISVANRRNPASGSSTPNNVRTVPSSSAIRSKFAHSPLAASRSVSLTDKPLPRAPFSTPHPVPFESRYEQPRQAPTSARIPRASTIGLSASSSTSGTTRKPSAQGHVPRDSRTGVGGSTRELADFLKETGPSDGGYERAERGPRSKQSARSASMGARDVLDSVSHREATAEIAVPVSQGRVTVVGKSQNNDTTGKPGDLAGSLAAATAAAAAADLRTDDPSNIEDRAAVQGSHFSGGIEQQAGATAATGDLIAQSDSDDHSEDGKGSQDNIAPFPRREETRPGSTPISRRISRKLRNSATSSKHVPRESMTDIAERKPGTPDGSVRKYVIRDPRSSSSRTQTPDQSITPRPQSRDSARQAEATSTLSDNKGKTSGQNSASSPTQPAYRLESSAGNGGGSGQKSPRMFIPRSATSMGSVQAVTATRDDSQTKDPSSPKTKSESRRPSSRLGLFPSLTASSSQANLGANKSLESNSSRTGTIANSSPVNKAGSITSRTMSFKKFFHVKRESQSRGSSAIATE